MRRASIAASLLFAAAAIAAPPRDAYDAMAHSFGPHLNPADPLAWPAKVRAIARDEYHFWRGTRDLFYGWCGANCRDWLDDPSAYVVSQGDLHLGNMGTFAAGPFGATASGLVDFDESARLPFQIELLQGVITFDLLAKQNDVDLSSRDRAVLHDALLNAYAEALAGPTAGTTAAVDTGLAALLPARHRDYADDLKRFTVDDHFRPAVVKKNGDVTDVLRPMSASRRDSLAAALAEAVQHDARLSALLRPYDATHFKQALFDAAERVRLDSSGSQGLSKVLVLLRRPFRDAAGDGLLYLKQQIPSAAERAGLVPPDDRPPALRYVRDLDALTHGRSLAASWCEWEGRSYWVSVKEPWSDEVDDKKLKTVAALTSAARVWSRVLADAHAADAARLAGRLTPGTRDAIVRRADAYSTEASAAFRAFVADTRVSDAVTRFDAATAVHTRR